MAQIYEKTMLAHLNYLRAQLYPEIMKKLLKTNDKVLQEYLTPSGIKIQKMQGAESNLSASPQVYLQTELEGKIDKFHNVSDIISKEIVDKTDGSRKTCVRIVMRPEIDPQGIEIRSISYVVAHEEHDIWINVLMHSNSVVIKTETFNMNRLDTTNGKDSDLEQRALLLIEETALLLKNEIKVQEQMRLQEEMQDLERTPVHDHDPINKIKKTIRSLFK